MNTYYEFRDGKMMALEEDIDFNLGSEPCPAPAGTDIQEFYYEKVGYELVASTAGQLRVYMCRDDDKPAGKSGYPIFCEVALCSLSTADVYISSLPDYFEFMNFVRSHIAFLQDPKNVREWVYR
jgi:hypothetical protein